MDQNERDQIYDMFEKRWQVKHRFLKLLDDIKNEYLLEAEHQDGTAYWDECTPEEFIEDFARYISNRAETQRKEQED